MGGPIVRTGTNPKFWENWENVFGKKKKKASTSASAKKTTKKSKGEKDDFSEEEKVNLSAKLR